MRKMVLFTHDDLDGAGCSVVFNAFNFKYASINFENSEVFNCDNGDDIDYKIINYVMSPYFNRHQTELLISDICPSENTIKVLLSKNISVKILDHHNTNKWVLKYLPNSIVTNENNCCGTSLLYDYLCDINESFKNHNLLIDDFVNTIRSYDTYEWKSTNNIDALKLNILFKLMGMQNFVDEFSQRMGYSYPYVQRKYGVDLIRGDHALFVENALRV